MHNSGLTAIKLSFVCQILLINEWLTDVGVVMFCHPVGEGFLLVADDVRCRSLLDLFVWVKLETWFHRNSGTRRAT